MIIKKLILHNFGVYAFTNTFEFHSNKPIVLIGGMNGRGKTTFLEAVLLALYGSNSFTYIEKKYKTYGQYLRSLINISDGTLITYLDLEFTMDTNGGEIYRIHREWNGKKKRIVETIQVYKETEIDQFLTDNWTMFIENILPSGLLNFFFFDGEKIAELAVENTSSQMKESIKSLLGISVLDLLESDLNRIINRTVKKQIEDLEVKEIEYLRARKDAAIEKLETVDLELKDLDQKRVNTQQKLERKRQEYAAKGGDIVTQRQELFQKRSAVSTKIESIHELLILDAASELPLVLVKDLLGNISKNAEMEQDKRMLDIVLKKIRLLSIEFEKQNGDDADVIFRFMEFIEKKSNKKNDMISYNLSDTSLLKLQMLLDEQLMETKLSTVNRQQELVNCQENVNQLDSYLSIDINEKVVARIYKKIKELEQELIALNVQIARKEDERRNCNGEVITATSIFNKQVESYLKRVELNDDSDRIVKYSHMASAILEEYKVRLQKNKINVVAETMTTCYRKLANKKTLIERICMDSVTLDLRYINFDGEEIDKASLSAGEKQLMVIALLWALALCSKKKLPVIIDTPLSRLDSAHRVSLIQTYFPQASEQTIILSTDSEIDHHYYEIMKDNIGDEFTLVYDDSSKSTTIRKGYFMEGTE